MMLMPSIFKDNLFDVFGDFRFAPPAPEYAKVEKLYNIMKADVKENDNGYDLSVELPGFDKNDIKLTLKNGYLNIHTETKNETTNKDEKGSFILRERYYGNYSRKFYVGDKLTREDIKAKYENGILNVFIPKKETLPEADVDQFIAIEG